MFSSFTIHPPSTAGEGTLRAVVTVDGRDYSFARERIAYPHIGAHLLMPPAGEARIVRADVRKKGELIGYIPGAGDEIPQSLQQIGYNVKVLEVAEITADNLKRFDAVVLGIRAYNTHDWIANWLPELLAYVKRAAWSSPRTQTADLKTKEIGPFPLEISRDRVTDETAEMRILAPDHPLLNSPNKITAEDFKDWVQERGLYFPNKWDAAWTPILSCNDPGEKPLDGGLLVAKVGQRLFHLHRSRVVPAIAGRSPGRLSAFRQHGLPPT